MKPINTLEEAYRYLLYVADTLYNVGSSFHIDKQDKIVLEKCANDLAEYAKVIEQLKNNMAVKEQIKKKELEDTEEK